MNDGNLDDRKKRIISNVLFDIKEKREKVLEESKDLSLSERFINLVSNIPDKNQINEKLSSIHDFTEKEEAEIFKKAGILAFLYGLLTKTEKSDFSYNLEKSSFKSKLELETLTTEDAEIKGIQCSFALLLIYQPKIDAIMNEKINASSSNESEKYSVNDLDGIDYEFIKIGCKDKGTVIYFIENGYYTDIENIDDENIKKFLKKIPTGENLSTRIPKWSSLNREENVIDNFIANNASYSDFRSKVMTKYIESFSPIPWNDFLIKFSKIWGKEKVKQLLELKSIKKRVLKFIRGRKGGYHEHLLASMYAEYLTNEKWGEDGLILTMLLKKLVQETKKVVASFKGNDVSHYEACGTESVNDSQDWLDCRNLIKNDLHKKEKNAIDASNSAAEVLFKIRKVVYDKDLHLNEATLENFYEIFNNILKETN